MYKEIEADGIPPAVRYDGPDHAGSFKVTILFRPISWRNLLLQIRCQTFAFLFTPSLELALLMAQGFRLNQQSPNFGSEFWFFGQGQRSGTDNLVIADAAIDITRSHLFENQGYAYERGSLSI